MKFSILSAIIGLCAVTSVTGSPVASSELIAARMDNGLETRTPSLEPFSARDTVPEPDASSLDLTTHGTHDVAKRDLFSDFKVHLVTSTGRVIAIVAINYVIHELAGVMDENLTATYGKLTNVPTNGGIVAAKFDNPTLFGSAQSATFSFFTKAVSGHLDLSMDAAGNMVGVKGSTGIHLGNLVVAKALHVFDTNRKRIGVINL
ncbi:uncharacterized protein M421DRAFT_417141 [Didymella exigua CBS 183.55]|uniref:Uncharacterized protein n=1 Tax=Didymella exigua CBS 183.55 TaxID=1150837 RepID=A0A6A5RYJ2_9PLEO|nr:uncharacterized protein M421DRAFT_417141 [Didymella exigua CBS 183.55]KAF1932420.1 hypothetical protein M421DRAFT_417141 [Didymella exigua CBS 183.55]